MSQIKIDQHDDQLTIGSSVGPWGAQLGVGVFMGVWVSGWTVGCVLLLRKALAEPTLEHIVFAIPFLAAWFLGAFVFFGLLAGNDTLVLDAEQIAVRHRWIVPWRGRRVPLTEVRSVSIETSRRYTTTTARKRRESIHRRVRIDTPGRPLYFDAYFEREDSEAIINAIQSHLDRHAPQTQRYNDDRVPSSLTANPYASVHEKLRECRANGDGRIEVALAEDDLPLRPTEPEPCDWKFEADIDGLRFHWGGGLSILGIFLLLAINGFWNGIVSVFIIKGIQDKELPVLLFMIPFVAVGLILLGALLAVVSMPLWRRTWSFSRHALDCRFTVLGLGRRWHYDILGITQMTLCDQRSIKSLDKEASAMDEGRHWMLCFEDRGPAGRIELGDLTEGEALWMAALVRANLPQWFR